MSDTVGLQYVGFETKGAVHEYDFTLHRNGGASSEYFVSIANDAFVTHCVRYQNAPDIYSLRLHREFATQTDYPLSTRFSITDAELADYQYAPARKARPAYTHRQDEPS